MSITPDRIFISQSPGETRMALVADHVLLEVAHLRDAEVQVGAVYAGRVGECAPGSDDVFVDIGIPPHGLLKTKGQKFSAGQLVAVEIVTPARAGKGHKLKLSQAKVLEAIKAPNIIKSAGHPVMGWWNLYKNQIVEIVAEPIAQRKTMMQLLGADAPIVAEAANEMTFGEVEEQIDEAVHSIVRLRSGGKLIIEQTSALMAIDIDAGASTIDQANAEAMTEIAHQIRLRNLAGHILIDLIPTKTKQRFVTMLKEVCAVDPVDTRVMGLTPSGMIDVVRQRKRPSLEEILLSPETSAYKALRVACRELVARRVTRVQLKVAASVAALLNEALQSALAEARETAKGDVIVVPQSSFPIDRIEVDG